jgi:hypothetical protein
LPASLKDEHPLRIKILLKSKVIKLIFFIF